MFYYWALVNSCCLSSGCINANTISETEYVFESFMLKCVWIDINDSLGISNAWIKKLLLWLAWWINASSEKVLFNNLSIVYISESCNFLSNFVCLNRNHFPAEEYFNTSFFAFFKSNFISILKFENLLVRSPVLYSSILSSSSLKNILSQEVLVIKWVEICSFPLVREFRWITNHVSISMVPSMIVVFINSLLSVNGMNKYATLSFHMFKLGKSLYMFSWVIESSCDN